MGGSTRIFYPEQPLLEQGGLVAETMPARWTYWRVVAIERCPAGVPASRRCVLPSEPELREAHYELLRLRKKAIAHIDDTDSPAPRAVERFPDLDNQGVTRWRFQTTGGFQMFSEGQLGLIERLIVAVSENVEIRLKEATRAELSSLPGCAGCGRGPLEDDWPTLQGDFKNAYVFCPECAAREFDG